MKHPFRKKFSWAWQTALFFGFFAVLWHFPLLLAPAPKPKLQLVSNVGDHEHYLILQPVSSSSASAPGFSWVDPTVYLLPTDLGFSASLREAAHSFQPAGEDSIPPVMTLPFEPLATHGEVTGEEALATIQASLDSWLSEAKEGASVSEGGAKEGSAWEAMGALAERHPLASSELPVVFSSEALGATVLRVAVGGQGDPQYITIERSSGVEKVDEAAVRFVKAMKFSPLDAGANDATVWGMVRIFWRAERSSPKSDEGSVRTFSRHD